MLGVTSADKIRRK